jgi:Ni/Fe-hydrogenase subunit HybB-like protein
MHTAKPVGGTLFTRSYKVILAFAALGLVLIVWRLFAGLGKTTALSDGYPWGLWIAFDVVTGTALACGGYAVAILIYIINRGKYHPLIRPAILTSALGYTIAGASVFIDIGRWWNIWKVPLFFWRWNFNSVLLEVALCIMAYMFVLWIELAPVFLEKFQTSKIELLARFSKATLPFFNKALIFIIALGMLLPTMHQSSLGSLMLLSGPRLHGLWNSPFLPLFFLMTCVAMGYSIVVFESVFSSIVFKRGLEVPILKPLQKIAAYLSVTFVVLRFIDLAYRGQLALVAKLDLYGVMFWIETILFCIPLVMVYAKFATTLPNLFRGAVVLAVAGGVYRFDTFLTAFNPGAGWHYFPSVTELLITLGLVAIEIAVYVALVRTFPILTGDFEAAN